MYLWKRKIFGTYYGWFSDFNEKKTTCKTKNLYILLAFLVVTIALLIAIRIYCYLIKKHLLPFHDTNNELREV